ncbi:MAG: hypothetical protein J2P17_04420, partial [Mycobacterium sp.]|nr:hypothetical protein [Mycobacterium sp.]
MPNQALAWCKKMAALCLMLTIAIAPSITPALAQPDERRGDDSDTATPIKHVIVIVGENRSFDHVFATYAPKAGETVNSLLSEGIVTADGMPGRNFSRAVQNSTDVTGAQTFQLSPTTPKTPYSPLPAPLTGGPSNVCTDNHVCSLVDATSSEDGLPAADYQSLLVGGTGLSGKVPDSRIAGVSATVPYSSLK